MTLAKANPEYPLAQKDAQDHADFVIAQYAGWATSIMRVVEDKQLYADISGKKYLEFEAWQIIGSFDNCFVDTDDVVPIVEAGIITGYMCHAKLLRDGIRVGGASQICGLDAFPCQGKEGSAKNNAAISAAQTWAGSKALKMRYSSVAVLGGYGAATGDEMRRAEEEANKSEHWCEPHQTNWFKRGKMRGYAHPVGETGEWCNEATVVKIPETAQPAPAPSARSSPTPLARAVASGETKPTPAPRKAATGPLITSAEANQLMNHADDSGISRSLVMDYIMAKYNLNTPLKLTPEQGDEVWLYIDIQAGVTDEIAADPTTGEIPDDDLPE